jgi:hypothetical protein
MTAHRQGPRWAIIAGVTGPVEQAVRGAISPGDRLATPSGRGHFTVARSTTDRLVLLLGEKEAWTPLPWQALEEVPGFLHGRGWVLIGSIYSTDSPSGGLEEHLKRFLKRVTAGWVAVVLERAAASLSRSECLVRCSQPAVRSQRHGRALRGRVA